MTYRPRIGRPGVIWSFALEALGDSMAAVQGGFVTGAWPTANRAIFVPFEVESPRTATQMVTYNGTTASGNLDAGIYDINGNRLRSTGSTAQAGTAALQVINITDLLLTPGLYFMSLVLDNTTGGFVRNASALLMHMEASGLRHMASAFPLPDPATYAVPNSVYFPAFGVTTEITAV